MFRVTRGSPGRGDDSPKATQDPQQGRTSAAFPWHEEGLRAAQGEGRRVPAASSCLAITSSARTRPPPVTVAVLHDLISWLGPSTAPAAWDQYSWQHPRPLVFMPPPWPAQDGAHQPPTHTLQWELQVGTEISQEYLGCSAPSSQRLACRELTVGGQKQLAHTAHQWGAGDVPPMHHSPSPPGKKKPSYPHLWGPGLSPPMGKGASVAMVRLELFTCGGEPGLPNWSLQEGQHCKDTKGHTATFESITC